MGTRSDPRLQAGPSVYPNVRQANRIVKGASGVAGSEFFFFRLGSNAGVSLFAPKYANDRQFSWGRESSPPRLNFKHEKIVDEVPRAVRTSASP